MVAWDYTNNQLHFGDYITQYGTGVGIGTYAPTSGYKLEVVGQMMVSASAAGGGDGKINAGTVDPPYTIGGKGYATYMPAMTGVKEETTGNSKCQITNGKCEIALSLTGAAEGSDLWLFAKATNLSAEGLGNVTVLLTPNFDGKAWYEKKDGKIIIHAVSSDGALRLNIAPLEVSYRLTAPRFDYEGSQFVNTGVTTFGNLRPASDKSEGFNLDKLLK